MTSIVSHERRDGLAIVTIDNPPVNALSYAVRAGLIDAVHALEEDPAVIAVVLRCAGRTFVAGADIRELGQPPRAPILPEVIEAIEGARVPWIAAIHGTALGGGLELALGCHARIADPGTKLGLPEASLGTIPGAGGTVRLPRLIPIADAIELVTSGKPIDAAQALKVGLVDRIAEGDLLDAAATLARELLTRPMPAPLVDRPCPIGEAVDWNSRAKALARKARGAQAPLEALEALREGVSLSGRDALTKERERFLRLVASEEAAALRYAFFSERNAGKSLAAMTAEPADLSRVGVVGGGTMGAGIAIALLLSGSAVSLLERDEATVAAARKRVLETLQASAARGAITLSQADDALARLTATHDYTSLSDCPLVIEAVFEDMDVKKQVFAQLDAVMPPKAVLATNTSYLDVDALAEATADPTRVLGLHFFAPAHVMKLLEIVRGKRTGDRSLATGSALARRLKKIQVVSGVCHGFIGNRIMAAYRRDCEFMLLEGALPAQIDTAMKAFGFAMGIFEAQDLSGLDIAWAQRRAAEATRDRSQPYCQIADRLCELGRLGRKTRKGWYDYSSGEPQTDPAVTRIIEEERVRTAAAVRGFSNEEIIRRIIRVMQQEGEALLAEGIAESAADIDVVMVSGYGFPRHRGGPMYRKQSTVRDCSLSIQPLHFSIA
ncbi:3-hydroxyacyl-CoA dehydrogenase NAD-binding domain-containing protein [Sinorhizobium alkalisoli]|uniref:3-hydroxyacyl-CoA dehydrogenase NAD-binding domain-containing protein n=1 Tax=Sinorhizobium alkalisoli TaxID=1752398 RepID=UPI00124E3310|nr:3-hydroxyacyl-CoA dehydrogenase NAD-binding domain-containing protein [Sinorhizobium alkalisoli]QFI66462.1 Enoyl-CoA hydratase [Sinorhizobium alkalisoli]